MIELEVIINEINRLYVNEKGLRNKIHLEQSLDALKKYEQLTRQI